MHGIPFTSKSDIGPPFNSNEFKEYLTKLGVKQQKSKEFRSRRQQGPLVQKIAVGSKSFPGSF
jgi:hypothetical protein